MSLRPLPSSRPRPLSPAKAAGSRWRVRFAGARKDRWWPAKLSLCGNYPPQKKTRVPVRRSSPAFREEPPTELVVSRQNSRMPRLAAPRERRRQPNPPPSMPAVRGRTESAWRRPGARTQAAPPPRCPPSPGSVLTARAVRWAAASGRASGDATPPRADRRPTARSPHAPRVNRHERVQIRLPPRRGIVRACPIATPRKLAALGRGAPPWSFSPRGISRARGPADSASAARWRLSPLRGSNAGSGRLISTSVGLGAHAWRFFPDGSGRLCVRTR